MFCKFSLPFREDCFIIIMLNYSCTPAGTGRTAWKGDRDDLQRPFFQAIGRLASLRCWCPLDVRVRVPPSAPKHRSKTCFAPMLLYFFEKENRISICEGAQQLPNIRPFAIPDTIPSFVNPIFCQLLCSK